MTLCSALRTDWTRYTSLLFLLLTLQRGSFWFTSKGGNFPGSSQLRDCTPSLLWGQVLCPALLITRAREPLSFLCISSSSPYSPSSPAKYFELIKAVYSSVKSVPWVLNSRKFTTAQIRCMSHLYINRKRVGDSVFEHRGHYRCSLCMFSHG